MIQSFPMATAALVLFVVCESSLSESILTAATERQPTKNVAWSHPSHTAITPTTPGNRIRPPPRQVADRKGKDLHREDGGAKLETSKQICSSWMTKSGTQAWMTSWMNKQTNMFKLHDNSGTQAWTSSMHTNWMRSWMTTVAHKHG